jgi:predicted nucleic acid-binding protein
MIIVDASFLVAFKNRRDALHEKAAAHMPVVASRAPMLVHEYAFAEIVTVLLARSGLQVAVETGRELLESAEVEIVPASSRFGRSWERFSAQRGTRHSLADAALLALAQERGVSAIATFDREFRKARGLEVVPSS